MRERDRSRWGAATMHTTYRFSEGTAALLVSLPHVGTAVPPDLFERMTPEGRLLADTDWYVDRLYEDAGGLGASVLQAQYSRYVVDLNRAPSGQPLYPGADNTEVCPLMTFDNKPIWRQGEGPEAKEAGQRVEAFWQPYHARLAAALEAIRAQHGLAVLIDGHSIRSRVPRFFPGRLPDLNFGSARGQSADRRLAQFVYDGLEAAEPYSAVRDGRFTGGYITRHYGRPKDGLHAMQLEIAQLTYMEEAPPFRYRPDRARELKPVLRRMLEVALNWAEETKARAQRG